jgi:hypothetical protein
MAASETVQNFFTASSFGTVAGASAAVVAVANTVRTLTRWQSPWPAFIASCIVAFVGASIAKTLSGASGYGLAILNACLLFCSATGLQDVVVRATQPAPPKLEQHAKRSVKWLSKWL